MREFAKMAVALAACVSCASLARPGTLPQQEEMVRHFEAHQQVFDELVAMVEADALWSVSLSSVPGPVAAQASPASEMDVPPNAQAYAEALRTVGLSEVTRADGFVFVAGGPLVQRGTSFRASFVFSPAGVVPEASCSERSLSESCGRCALALAPGWSLRYLWRPEDTGEAERVCGARSA